MKLWQMATGEPWAMTTPALQTVLAIAARKMGSHNDSIDAIAARLGQDLDNTHHVTVRDGVAVIPVVGPLFRYANLFTRVSGATSYELLAQDITTALDNEDIHSLILNIDSPGGEVNGCAELSQLIFNARGRKPIVAYVSGDAASGAYWIASACDAIVVSATSGLGSIGVVGVYRVGDDETDTTIEIVSSQSPHKRLDVQSDDDRALIQSRIDDLAAVFIRNVAEHRGVSSDMVISKYGGGNVMIGEHAVACGLADRLGSFETLLSELHTQNPAQQRGFLLPATSSDVVLSEENPMADETKQPNSDPQPAASTPSPNPSLKPPLSLASLQADHPDLVAAIRGEGYDDAISDGVIKGAEQERQRIGAILNAEAAEGRESLARHFAFETAMSVQDVLAALDASPIAKTASAEDKHDSPGFAQVMATIPNPDVDPAADNTPQTEAEQVAAIAERIAGCHNPSQRRLK